MDMTQTDAKYSDRMSDESVSAATGKTWSEWFSLLNAAGARNWTHQQIVAHLHEQHGVGPWWQQMVTVQYEREAGLRDKHQRPDGFQISVSKTINRPIADVFEAWSDAGMRAKWIADPGFTVRKATPCKSMRITWIDGSTSVEAMFYEKGVGKCQVTAQHSKLADAETAAAMKTYWSEQLEKLKSMLEGS
jgi:uncharacterized protein YndB with AHSA1/START domain